MDQAAKPKQYIRPMPVGWWLHNRQLVLFMVREITAVFVALYALFLICVLERAGGGRDAFHHFFQALKSPGMIVFHLVTLAFVAYHSITWFNLTPKVVIIWRGEEKVGPAVIQGMHYALWAAASLLIVVLLLIA